MLTNGGHPTIGARILSIPHHSDTSLMRRYRAGTLSYRDLHIKLVWVSLSGKDVMHLIDGDKRAT